MSNTLSTRAQSLLVICAVLAVMASCMLAVAHLSLAAGPACHSLVPADSAPVGYRMPRLG